MSLLFSKKQENHIRFCKKRPFNGLERHTSRAPGSIRSFTKNTVNVTKNMYKIMTYQYENLFFPNNMQWVISQVFDFLFLS